MIHCSAHNFVCTPELLGAWSPLGLTEVLPLYPPGTRNPKESPCTQRNRGSRRRLSHTPQVSEWIQPADGNWSMAFNKCLKIVCERNNLQICLNLFRLNHFSVSVYCENVTMHLQKGHQQYQCSRALVTIFTMQNAVYVVRLRREYNAQTSRVLASANCETA